MYSLGFSAIQKGDRLTGNPRIKHIRVDISLVWPANGTQIGINPHLGKKSRILEGRENTGETNYARDVHDAFNTILEPQVKVVIL